MLFDKILVAYDGSKASKKALDKALELTKLTPGVKLDVIHVYDFPRFYVAEGFVPISPAVHQEFYDMAQQTVDDATRRIEEAGINGHAELVQGSPSEAILEYAKQKGHDVIIIGSRGLGGIREFVLGSVSHNVVQHARVPVLVVK